ncbi:MAG: glyoxalase [Caballeronia sp.]|jgi:catechol 2,3-dioxygenase-like lactoylglutathione lyase family enzyme|uniref:VOC family protein n=1 Tax=Caballeronia sp. TaxID=1931223 RepID=UPI0026203470|nr:VOC family protein [Caballeronia sp.]MDB5835605.1 glyoxalase [Caballeronia sp.]
MNLPPAGTEPLIEGLSAITFSTRDMQSAVRFYQALGFPLLHGGENEPFTSFAAGGSFLNLTVETRGPVNWWGRVIIYVSNVDAMYHKALAAGFTPAFTPRDAPWNERYFHIVDPDGHELSFARPLS